MQPHALICVVHEEVPLGLPSLEETRARAKGLTELLVLISRLPAPFPISLALTDQTLTMITRAPSVWSLFSAELEAQRLELLLTGGVPPLLPLVPAHLRTGMLKEQRLKLLRLQKRNPSGAWLQGLAWDPGLLSELRAEDIDHTFLPEALFTSDTGAALPPGPLLIAHEGLGLKTLLVSDHASSIAHAQSGLDAVLAGARGIPHYTVWTPSLESLASPQTRNALLTLMNTALDHPATVAPHLASLWVKHVPCRRHPAPACGLHPALRLRLGEVQRHTQLRQRSLQEEQGRSGGAKRGTNLGGMDHPPLLATWDALLSLYPEADRQYQRMLHFSRQLQHLWTSAERRKLEGDLPVEVSRTLEQARRQLLSLWHHAYWWPGTAEGPYRRSVREQRQTGRIRLQRDIDALLFPEPRWVSIDPMGNERLDSPKFLVGTPALEASVDTRGGALSALLFKPGNLTFCDFPMRRMEPYHRAILAAGGGTKARRPLKGPTEDPEKHSPQAAQLRSRLKIERQSRALFRDLLLRPGATPQSLHSDQAPEWACLADQDFEIIRTQYERARGIGTLQLATSCWQEGGGETRGSIRIDKTFVFKDDVGELAVEILLTNRGHDPLELWYGIECPVGMSLRVSGVEGEGGTLEGLPEGSVGALAGVKHLQWVGDLQHVGPGLESPQRPEPGDQTVRARLETSGAPELWWYPIEVVIPNAEAVLELEAHGTAFNLVWKQSLWGHEKLRIYLTLRLEIGLNSMETTAASNVVVLEED